MWIEVILQKGDVERLLGQLMPITIDIGDEGDLLALDRPKDVAFVAGEGLRVGCEAKVRWSVLGIDIPVTIHDVRVVLRPDVVRGPGGGDMLTFRLFVEHADIAGLPTIADEHITDKVNAVLEARHLETAVSLAGLLSGSFRLPPSLRPLTTMSLDVAWAKLRVTSEAMVMAISFHATVTRDEGPSALVDGEPMAVPPLARVHRAPSTSAPLARVLAFTGGSLALSLAVAYGAFRLGTRRTRFWRS